MRFDRPYLFNHREITVWRPRLGTFALGWRHEAHASESLLDVFLGPLHLSIWTRR